MKPESFVLIGRFPLNTSCRVKTNAAVIVGESVVRINDEIDSPVFLYKHREGFFVQVASQTNGCMILVHENDIELFDQKDRIVSLLDINIQPHGELN